MAVGNEVINFVKDPKDTALYIQKSNDLEKACSWDSEPPCHFTTVLEKTIEAPYSVFFEKSVSDWTSADPVILYSPCNADTKNGCEGIDMKRCDDKSVLFDSWRTLWNCLSLARTTLAYRRWPELFSNNHPVVDNVKDALSPLGMDISALDDMDAMRIFNLTFECAKASCDDWSMDGGCAVDYPQGTNFTLVDDGRDVGPNTSWGPVMVEAMGRTCDDLPTLNVDIAGQGVLISYMIQSVSVVGIVFILTAVFADSIINLWAMPFQRMRRSLKGPFTHRFPRVQRFFSRIQDNRVIHSAMTLLVDFQEAQCFFLMGVQVAVLIATSQKADFHGTFTIFSLRNNRRANRGLANLGLMAVCLIQMTLRRFELDSAYTFFLSLCALLVASVAREIGFDRNNMEATMNSINEIMPVEECGKLGSLRVQCLGQTRFAGLDDEFMVVGQQAVYYAAFLMLSCAKLSRELSQEKYSHFLRQWTPRWLRRGWVRTTLKNTATAILGLSEFFIGLSLCQNATELFYNIEESDIDAALDSGMLDSSIPPTWNIGQVLAVLVWAPVLFKFIYLLIRGIEDGFRMRLSNSYTVRRVLADNDALFLGRDSLELDDGEEQEADDGQATGDAHFSSTVELVAQSKRSRRLPGV